MMRFGYYALKNGDWEECKRTYKAEVSATEWTFGRIREAFKRVARDEAEILSIVQRNMLKSTDFLRRIIAPAGGQGGVTLSYSCSHCNCFPLEVYIWWVSTGNGDSNNKKKQHCSWCCANCGETYEWKAPNRLLVVQTGDSASKAKVFKAHAVPQGPCEILTNALMLLANKQMDGYSPIQSIVAGPRERSRKGIMEVLRNYCKVDNQRALEVGHLREGSRPFQVRRP